MSNPNRMIDRPVLSMRFPRDVPAERGGELGPEPSYAADADNGQIVDPAHSLAS